MEITAYQLMRVDDLIWKIMKQLTNKKNMILSEFKLTCLQYDILSAIYHALDNGENVRIFLSEKMQIAPMTTSIVLRNLERRGLIKRESDPVESCAIEAKLTKSGRSLYNLAESKVEKMRKDLYRGLNQQEFVSQLMTLSDELDKD
jgi:DNA-binding MarR family transcriptional regulator